MTPEVKAALREHLINSGFFTYSKHFNQHLSRYSVSVDEVLAALQPEVERLVVEARIDQTRRLDELVSDNFEYGRDFWTEVFEEELQKLTQQNRKGGKV